MATKLLIGNQVIDINKKGITKIPGWAEAFNNKQTSSGVELYQTSPTAYTCIRMRSNTLSAIPWQVVKQGKEDDEPLDDSQPVVRLLDEVNEEANWVDLIRATENDMMIWGAAYWQKIGTDSNVTSIMRLNAGTMKVKSNRNGISGFEQKLGNGETEKYTREEIVYFHTYNPAHDYEGLSPLSVAQAAILVESASLTYIGAFFDNYAVPAAVLQTLQGLTEGDYQRTQRWYERLFNGAKNQFRTAILEKGLELKTVGSQPKDLALKDTRAEARRDICAILGVPPAIAGAWEAANYATADEQHQGFYEDTIIPEAEYFAGVINAELVQLFDMSYEFEWKFEDITVLQDDANDRMNAIAKLVEQGVIKPEVGAVELGYQEEDAGIGPVQTNVSVDPAEEEPSDLKEDLRKWEKKANNALERKGSASVGFESDSIPKSVRARVFGDLEACKTKQDVCSVFEPYMEI